MTIEERVEEFVKTVLSSAEPVREIFKTSLLAAIEEEREACAKIAEQIRARELNRQQANGIFYDTIAEEIRDRIQMRPASSNNDWSELI